MFLENKYTKWYYSIIANAKLKQYEGYTEKHHIIPKSFGGEDTEENLVRLSAKEHFICHLLLIRMTEGIYRAKMIFAAWYFQGNKKHKPNFIITSNVYEKLKKERSIAMKNRIMSPEELENRRLGYLKNTGQKRTEETKKKIRDGNKGQKRSIECKHKTSEAMKLSYQNMSEETKIGWKRKLSEVVSNRSEETKEQFKQKHAKIHIGRKNTEETKLKMREAKLKNLVKATIIKKKNAKIWQIRNIDGTILEISDLRKFAKDNNLSEKALYRSKEKQKYVGDFLVLGNKDDLYEVEVYKEKN